MLDHKLLLLLGRNGKGLLPMVQPESELNLLDEAAVDLKKEVSKTTGFLVTPPYNETQAREETRGDLARGLLWLLTFAIGGVLAFIGLGRLEGTVLSQSIFPSLVALAGTALGFYFGSQTARSSDQTASQLPAFQPAMSQPSPLGGGSQTALEDRVDADVSTDIVETTDDLEAEDDSDHIKPDPNRP